MEVTIHLPDDVAERLTARGEVSRRVLEALAAEGFREGALSLYQDSQMLGLSRVETEDFLGNHHVPHSPLSIEELDQEAAVFKAAMSRQSR